MRTDKKWIKNLSIVFGILFVIFFGLSLLCIYFLHQMNLAAAGRVRSDMRAVAMAIEVYYHDHGQYPAWSIGASNANRELSAESPYKQLPTFRHPAENENLAALTTPVSYITSYWPDPYASFKNREDKFEHCMYSYISRPDGYILFSVGLDRDVDITVDDFLNLDRNDTDSLLKFSWDPTNGTFSDGDIYRLYFRDGIDSNK